MQRLPEFAGQEFAPFGAAFANGTSIRLRLMRQKPKQLDVTTGSDYNPVAPGYATWLLGLASDEYLRNTEIFIQGGYDAAGTLSGTR